MPFHSWLTPENTIGEVRLAIEGNPCSSTIFLICCTQNIDRDVFISDKGCFGEFMSL